MEACEKNRAGSLFSRGVVLGEVNDIGPGGRQAGGAKRRTKVERVAHSHRIHQWPALVLPLLHAASAEAGAQTAA